MWMKAWQTLLFCVGCFIPVAFMPHPLPPMLQQSGWVMYAATGAALAWLGSVGISYLFTVPPPSRGVGSGADGTGPEGVTGRRETLPRD